MKTIFTLIAFFCLQQITFSQNTQQLKDIYPGQNGSIQDYEKPLINYNDQLIFSANDSLHGTELWASDGTENGTFMLKDIFAGNQSSECQFFYQVNDLVLFIAKDENGFELWRTDGTTDGTTLVKDINEGSSSSFIINELSTNQFCVFNDVLYFPANDGKTGIELWRSDGTESGTFLVRNIAPPFLGNVFNSNPNHLTVHDDKLFFSAAIDGFDDELWATDGTSDGTYLVKDINERSSFGSDPQSMISCNGFLLFTASTEDEGRELWRSDGTSEGTVLVKDIHPTSDGIDPQAFNLVNRFVKIGNEIFFAADDPINGKELWKSDGTEMGTTLVIDINQGEDDADPRQFTVLNDQLIFTCKPGFFTELWVSDGSESGTEVILDKAGNNAGVLIRTMTTIGDQIYFAGAEGFNTELWTTKGTTASTFILEDINPNGSSFPVHFVKLKDNVAFAAIGEDGREIWIHSSKNVVTPLSARFEIIDSIPCFGDMTGSLDVVAAGGKAPYRYRWENSPGFSSSRRGLGVGLYKATVTDADNNEVYPEFFFDQPDQLRISLSSTPDTASQSLGSASVTVAGGTPPYSYEWSSGVNSSDDTIDNLSAGQYTVTITDRNGCSRTGSVTVDQITSTQELKELSITIYPTITNSSFSVAASDQSTDFQVSMFDQTGKRLKEWNNVQSNQPLNIQEFAQGYYYVVLKSENLSIAKQLIIN